tara:strand:+ start:542 stop:793 length:252 start_codon:yes stop_codon:yes gene_type:complete
MLYGNLKNCTYTQTTGNCGAGVGFFIALLIAKYNPALISNEWYYFVIGLVIFMIPGLVSTYKQMKAGVSIESIDLNKRPFRTF